MKYSKHHIADEVINNESSGVSGLDVSVSVDTLENIIIELGSSMVIRTDEQGVYSLSHLLKEAIEKLESIRYENTCAAMDKLTESFNPVRSDMQNIDVFDHDNISNDPVDW